VLSPDPVSAAHRHARLAGLGVAWQLARSAPRFDAVVLRIEPGLPFHERDGRAVRAAVLIALGLSLQPYRDVTIRLDSPVPVPGGLGGRPTRLMWKKASSIVVADEGDRAMLAVVPGVDLARVVLEDRGTDTDAGEDRWPQSSDSDIRNAALSEVRRRAARDRAVARARAGIGAPGEVPVVPPFAVDPTPVRLSAQGVAAVALARSRRLVTRARALTQRA